MIKLVLLAVALASILRAQSSERPRAWQPGLPEDGIVAVSRIGHGKITRQLFNDSWSTFRTQYYVDERGAFTPHSRTLSMVSIAEQRNYGNDHANSWTRLRQFTVVGNADSDGKPINGFYLVSLSSGTHSQPAMIDARFQKPSQSNQIAYRFYVADPDIVRRGTFTADVDGSLMNVFDTSYTYTRSGFREYAPLPDKPKLQDSFIESLKAGSRFKIVIYRHTVCPYHTQTSLTPSCHACKGKGGAEFPHLLTFVW
jgi:hypothetical protein